MATIFDYIIWRDIELEKVEVNEIDYLILSRFSYLPFDGLIDENEKITIKECYERFKKKGKRELVIMKNDFKLFQILANSKRFGKLIITKYINKIDLKAEKQFSAICVFLPNKEIAVLFRGTDNSIIGWKEDFNMSFSTAVPSQQDAVEYLENISSRYKGKISITGHSKGGNLAIYSAVFCNKKTKKKIKKVYNFDGPGFNEKVIDSEEYMGVLEKIHNYIPQTSVVGRLFENKGKLTIVKSNEKGFWQHDLYSWSVLGDKFVESEITNSSEFVDKTLTNWLLNVDETERKKFVDTLFEIVEATGAKSFAEMSTNKFTAAKTIIKTYQHLDPLSKKFMNKALNLFLVYGKENGVELLPSRFRKAKK